MNRPTNSIQLNSSSSLSVVIPCYNEAIRIGPLIKGLEKLSQKWKGELEFIFVDDGSTDETVKVIHSKISKSADLKNSRVVSLQSNQGKGAALQSGVSEAHGELILTIDADNSYSPSLIINWLKNIEEASFSADTVYIGSRELEGSESETSIFRRISGLIFNGIIQTFTSIDFKDSQSGYKLYPKDIAKDLFLNLRSKGWAHDVELLNRAKQYGLKIKSMPVKVKSIEGSKLNMLKDSILMSLSVLGISLRGKWDFFIKQPLMYPRSPALYRILFAILTIVVAVMLPTLSVDYGLTGDEEVQKVYGEKALLYYESFGEDKSCLDYKNLYFYGAFFEVVTAFANKYLVPGLDDFTVRHFMNAILGFLLLFLTGKLAFRISNSWKVAFWSFLLAVLYPKLFGHAMNNPKDIPFACFFILGMIAIVRSYKEFPNISLKSIITFIIALGLAMGVRVGAILLIPFLGLFLLTAWSQSLKSFPINIKNLLNIASKGLIMSIFGIALGILFWPYALENPWVNPIKAFREMNSFSISIQLLYDNFHYWSDDLPWHYLPNWLYRSATIVVLLGSLLFLLLSWSKVPMKRKALYGLLIFSFVFPPAYAIISEASYYDGIRHFIFVMPILIICSVLGWFSLTKYLPKKLSVVPELGMGLLAFIPLFWIVRSHPNQYTYFNELTGGVGAHYGYYETDYWMNSLMETGDWFYDNVVKDLPSDAEIVVSTNAFVPLREYLRERDDRIKLKYTSYVNRNKIDSDYEIFLSRYVNKELLQKGFFPPENAIYKNELDGAIFSSVSKRLNGATEKKAMDLLKTNNFIEAEKSILQALQGNEKDEQLLESLSFIYLQTKNSSKFEETMAKLDDMSTSIATPCFYKGIHYLNQNDRANAKLWLENTVKYNYKLSTANFYLASIYKSENNWQGVLNAIISFEAAEGNMAQAYDLGIEAAENLNERAYLAFFKARKSIIEKDYTNGLAYLKKAIKLDSGLERANKLLRMLEEAMK